MLKQSDLAQFYGTEGYLRLQAFGVAMKFYATDGVKYVMENGGNGAYWLIDAILSYQKNLLSHADTRLREMQFWTLKVTEKDGNRSAVLICAADSGTKPAVIQDIEYTDFDLGDFKIWVEAGSIDGEHAAMILMLPSER